MGDQDIIQSGREAGLGVGATDDALNAVAYPHRHGAAQNARQGSCYIVGVGRAQGTFAPVVCCRFIDLESLI